MSVCVGIVVGSPASALRRRCITLRAVHRLLVLYPPPTDPDHFRSYYEDKHLPLVARFPGLRGYRYSFDVAAAGDESPYFCVFEADFDDAAALTGPRQGVRSRAVAPPSSGCCIPARSAAR